MKTISSTDIAEPSGQLLPLAELVGDGVADHLRLHAAEQLRA